MVHFITEKEFLPAYVTHCNIGKNETERGLYQIAYGVLQKYMSYDDMYDLIVRITKEQKSEVVKRFKLEAWRDEVKVIINNLKKLNSTDDLVMVYIPFTYYYDYLSCTLNRFEFVRFTIDEILAKGDGQMKTAAKHQYDYPIKALDLLIEDYRFKVLNNLSEEDIYDASYYQELIHDELIRRGVKLAEESFYSTSSTTDEPVKYTKGVLLSKSEHYKHPEKFFELNHFNERHKYLKVKIEEDADGRDSDGSPEEYDAQEKAGIIYFMLQDLMQEESEDRIRNKRIALIKFLAGKDVEPDTIRRYVNKFSNLSDNKLGRKFYKTVEGTLKRYGFQVPEEIKKRTGKDDGKENQ